MKNLIERYFEIEKERENIEKQLLETIVIAHEKTIIHRFRVVSKMEVEFFNAKTGEKYIVTPLAVGMHIESGSWVEK